SADDVSHDPALAGGVHSLQYQQHRGVGDPRPALRVQALLQFAERLDAGGEVVLTAVLAAGVPRGRVRVTIGEKEPVADPEDVDRFVGPAALAHAAILPDGRFSAPEALR